MANDLPISAGGVRRVVTDAAMAVYARQGYVRTTIRAWPQPRGGTRCGPALLRKP